MRAAARGLLLLSPICVLCAACDPVAGKSPRLAVTAEPDASVSALPAVVRLRIAGLRVDPAAVLLFEDPLDAYYSDRIRDGQISSTLASRRVPAFVWEDAARGALVLAPSVPLVPGTTYDIAALGLGHVDNVTVTEASGLPFAARVWPPPTAKAGGAHAVFCTPSVPLSQAFPVTLEPTGISANVTPGADSSETASDRCFRMDVLPSRDRDAAGEVTGIAVPPPSLDALALDPAPLSLGSAQSASAIACEATESTVGPGCATVEDDRAIVRSPSAPFLWTFRAPGEDLVVPLSSSSRFVVSGLAPSTDLRVAGAARGLDGVETVFDVTWHTLSPEPHVVVNEVLANPLGPEPSSEWIELVNSGLAPADLSGFTVHDVNGDLSLPSATLAPGEFALVVPMKFVPSSVDVAPVPGTRVLRIEDWGRGLSNAGEELQLRDATGEPISVLPALAPPRAGVSIARRTPASLDDDPDAAGPSAAPGASPGAPNVLATP